METNAILESYFRSVWKIFIGSQQSSDKAVTRRFSLLGQILEVVFSNKQLMPYITPALEHLADTTAGNSKLTVCVWDDVTTCSVMPPPPWIGHALKDHRGHIEGLYTNRGDIRGFNQNRIKAAYNWSAGSLSMYDPDQQIALYWTRDARTLPAYETSAPLRSILNWWAEERGCHFAHGAAVGTVHGVVLLAGKGGSGKSTAALAALNHGLSYISDDYCLVAPEPTPTAHCVFSSAKVDPGSVSRLDHLAKACSTAGNPDDEKTVLFLYPHFAGQISRNQPLRAILLPRITGKPDSALSPASRAECIKALTVSMMCQFPGAGKKAADMMIRLADALPCYTLDFGTDLTQAPDIISSLLKQKESTHS